MPDPSIYSRDAFPSKSTTTSSPTNRAAKPIEIVHTSELDVNSDGGSTASQQSLLTHSETQNEYKHVEASARIKRYRWTRVNKTLAHSINSLCYTLAICVVAGSFALFVGLSKYPDTFTSLRPSDVCRPDGRFDLSYDSYSPWNVDSVFAINIGLGSFSFGTAKFIDVCWDVGVGRGGQALLAASSYIVFTKALARSMESSTVPYATFKAITLQTNTITGTSSLAIKCFTFIRRRVKITMLWIVVASLFVLAVPTWLSAMSGYTLVIKPYVLNNVNALVPVDDFQPVIYTIHDGARLGSDLFSNDTRITVPWNTNYDNPVMLDHLNDYGCYIGEISEASNGTLIFEQDAPLECQWLWAISWYTSKYGFLGKSTTVNTSFPWPGASEPVHFSPALNISAHLVIVPELGSWSWVSRWEWYFSQHWSYTPYGRQWQDPDTGHYPFNHSLPAFAHPSSQTFLSLADFNARGSCQSVGDIRYTWGFSFILLYLFVVFFLIWVLGMAILYFDAWLFSRIDVARRHLGVERAVMDISTSLQPVRSSDQLEMCGNSELQALADDCKLSYSDLVNDPSMFTRWALLRQWWWRTGHETRCQI